MNLLPFLALLTVTAAWTMLPLLPALGELLRPTDAEPLDAVGQDAGDLTVFADGFREYLGQQLAAPSSPAPDGGAGALVAADRTGTLADGTPFVQLADAAALATVARDDGAIPSLVITTAPLTLAGGEAFLLECHARETLRGGADAVYRALLGERDLWLGARSKVLRWVHAVGELRVDRGSLLYGRASALGTLVMAPNVVFQRVRAARVVAGDVHRDLPADPPQRPPLIQGTVRLPAGARRERGYTRIAGDLELPSGGTLVGSVVVTGRLIVGEGGRIGGNVKVHGDCHLHDDVVIDGALVSRRSVRLGHRCHVRGPVVAERAAEIGAGSSVGDAAHPASVSADVVELRPGAQVFGAVTARQRGTVAE